MRVDVAQYVKNIRANRKLRHRIAAFLTAMSMAVSMTVFWQLRGVGTAMEEDIQTCSQQEHSHTDKCYEKVLVCQNTDSGHEHTGDCYEDRLICGLDEHTHSSTCTADKTADTETEAVWEQTLPKELGENVRENIALIAQSQLGYSESKTNFHIADDGETKNGYTRYGQWYGSPYGEWNSLFTYFCMYYAGVDRQSVPYGSGTAAWAAELEKKKLVQSIKDTTLQKGDVILIDTDLDDKADRSAVVTQLIEQGGKTQLEAIQGNVRGSVAKSTYQLDDKHIIGCVKLDGAAGEMLFEQVSASGVRVTAKADNGTFPENTTMTVTDIEKSEAVKTAQQGIGTAEKVVDAVAVDITFKNANGEEIEPAKSKNVTVQISLTGEKKLEGDNQKLLHKTDNGEVKAVENAKLSPTQADFTANSFSIYVWTTFKEYEKEGGSYKLDENGSKILIAGTDQPRFVDIDTLSNNNSAENPLVFHVGDTIKVKATGVPKDSGFTVWDNDDSVKGKVIERTPSGWDAHTSTGDDTDDIVAEFYVRRSGTPTVVWKNKDSTQTQQIHIRTENQILVKGQQGEADKDRINEYLPEVHSGVDPKYIVYSDAGEPLYIVNTNEKIHDWLNGAYKVAPGDTLELVTYERDPNADFTVASGQYVQKIGSTNREIVKTYGSEPFYRVSAKFEIEDPHLGYGTWETISFNDTNFYLVIDADKDLTHADIEIADGGTYSIEKTVTYPDNTKKVIKTVYHAYVYDVNHCYLYGKDNDHAVIQQFDSPHYYKGGTPGTTQYELTSNYILVTDPDAFANFTLANGDRVVLRDDKNFRLYNVDSATFDVKLVLSPSTETVTYYSADNVQTSTQTDPISGDDIMVESAVFDLPHQSVIDAYNKCPTHGGLDFTLKADLNEVINVSPALTAFRAKKVLRNQTLAGDQFEFELLNADKSRVVATAKNDADGNVVFPEQILLSKGEYTYYVKEVIPDGVDAYEFDQSEFKVVVTVDEDEQENRLVSSVVYYKDGREVTAPEFVNTFKKYTLPNTGGAGILPHLTLGSGLMLTAFVLLRKKRKEGG
ncbi:MAG: LPXTG cell wall anchor domain-containing protein [Ruminococcus sp.]|nr:LPXTG cell wall anchor domain-containing protein [Ruminococcus sp.]